MKGISVIIPTYNREKFVTEAIESVIAQNFDGDIEIIISDDGSTDKTLQLAYNFKNQIRILHKPGDCYVQGASGARNRGISAATHEFICFLDSDDFFLPGHLRKIYGAIAADKNLGFAFCKSLESIEVSGNNCSKLYKPWTKYIITEKDVDNLMLTNDRVANTNVFIFRKDVFNKVGFFDEGLMVGEDTDMWMRISEVYKGEFSNHFGAAVRLHTLGQLTKTPKKFLLTKYIQIYLNGIKRYFKLKLKNKYRLQRLVFYWGKYQIARLPGFYILYVYLNKIKNRQRSFDDRHFLPLSKYEIEINN